VVRSFFNILSSSRSASSICDDFRDPLATLLTKEGLTFNLLAIPAYTPAKADMIFPGVRPPDPGQSRTDVFSCRPIAFIADADTRGNAISSLSWQARLYEVLRACCSLLGESTLTLGEQLLNSLGKTALKKALLFRLVSNKKTVAAIASWIGSAIQLAIDKLFPSLINPLASSVPSIASLSLTSDLAPLHPDPNSLVTISGCDVAPGSMSGTLTLAHENMRVVDAADFVVVH
jgi:hypothetical protein